jgi:hypothetical protein
MILAVAIMVIAVLLLFLSFQRPPVSAIAIGFLGFTNSGMRAEALFAISNPPNSAVTLQSVTLKDANSSSATNRERGFFSWTRREPWGLPYAIGVDTTNEPLRVVFQFQRPAVGPRRIVERIKELFQKLRGNEMTHFTGSKFFVTNETSVVSTPH